VEVIDVEALSDGEALSEGEALSDALGERELLAVCSTVRARCSERPLHAQAYPSHRTLTAPRRHNQSTGGLEGFLCKPFLARDMAALRTHSPRTMTKSAPTKR
jgi:hypothetical protein